MSKRGKKHHHEEEAGEAWLLPYSDLMTLLLAVFIVLFAVSKMDSSKAEEIAKSFRGMFLSGGAGVMSSDGDSITPYYPDGSIIDTLEDGSDENGGDGSSEQAEMEAIQQQLEKYFEQEGLETTVSTHIDERGLVITLNNAIIFDSGSADIKPENEGILLEIASTINMLDNYIRVEGHTDNVAIDTAVYPSNWELSCARAARVVRLFADKGGIDPEKMVPVGYGEYKPVEDNSTSEGRAANRRIDIIILNAKYSSLENQIDDAMIPGEGDS